MSGVLEDFLVFLDTAEVDWTIHATFTVDELKILHRSVEEKINRGCLYLVTDNILRPQQEVLAKINGMLTELRELKHGK